MSWLGKRKSLFGGLFEWPGNEKVCNSKMSRSSPQALSTATRREGRSIANETLGVPGPAGWQCYSPSDKL